LLSTTQTALAKMQHQHVRPTSELLTGDDLLLRIGQLPIRHRRSRFRYWV